MARHPGTTRSVSARLFPVGAPVRAAGIALLGATLAACSTRGVELVGTATDEWSRSYSLQEGGEFQIVGANGTIDVVGGSGSAIEVRADRVVRAQSDASAKSIAARVRITEDVSPEKVVLRTEGLGGGIIIGVEIAVNYHVTLPASTRARLHTANGDVSVANVSGIVVASTTNGRIIGKALGGGVDARTSNGSIAMDLAAVSKDAVDLRTTNGGIELTLPASANANVEASCRNGSIDVAGLPLQLTVEQDRRRARGRLNDGGTPVEASTTNGNIRIRPRS
ncbi:MAG TPA: DUF4097 family beta strand repeat-containing protein [Vicinamibacterales bacterium]|nr:DUF4097 family beta strand repeat-containing protein [Vicinamibacterales bacterium]